MVKQVMSLVMVLAIAMPAGTVTAAPKSPKLARCDGHHRRTANLYGSILPTVDPQTGASTPASPMPGPGRPNVDVIPGKAPLPPKPAASKDKASLQVPPLSFARPLHTFQSC